MKYAHIVFIMTIVKCKYPSLGRRYWLCMVSLLPPRRSTIPNRTLSKVKLVLSNLSLKQSWIPLVILLVCRSTVHVMFQIFWTILRISHSIEKHQSRRPLVIDRISLNFFIFDSKSQYYIMTPPAVFRTRLLGCCGKELWWYFYLPPIQLFDKCGIG